MSKTRRLSHAMRRTETTSTAPRALRAVATGALAVGGFALGAIAVGAVTVGALAIGRLAVGRVAVGRARIGRLEIEELSVRRLVGTSVPAQLGVRMNEWPNPSIERTWSLHRFD